MPVLNPEKVIVPEEVSPVAAVIAPELFTWNCEVGPTESREAGVVVPRPSRLLVLSQYKFPSEAMVWLPVKNASWVGVPPAVVTPPPALAQLPVVRHTVPFASGNVYVRLPVNDPRVNVPVLPLPRISSLAFAERLSVENVGVAAVLIFWGSDKEIVPEPL